MAVPDGERGVTLSMAHDNGNADLLALLSRYGHVWEVIPVIHGRWYAVRRHCWRLCSDPVHAFSHILFADSLADLERRLEANQRQGA